MARIVAAFCGLAGAGRGRFGVLRMGALNTLERERLTGDTRPFTATEGVAAGAGNHATVDILLGTMAAAMLLVSGFGKSCLDTRWPDALVGPSPWRGEQGQGSL